MLSSMHACGGKKGAGTTTLCVGGAWVLDTYLGRVCAAPHLLSESRPKCSFISKRFRPRRLRESWPTQPIPTQQGVTHGQLNYCVGQSGGGNE